MDSRDDLLRYRAQKGNETLDRIIRSWEDALAQQMDDARRCGVGFMLVRDDMTADHIPAEDVFLSHDAVAAMEAG